MLHVTKTEYLINPNMLTQIAKNDTTMRFSSINIVHLELCVIPSMQNQRETYVSRPELMRCRGEAEAAAPLAYDISIKH
jgi:hypothetical protein